MSAWPGRCTDRWWNSGSRRRLATAPFGSGRNRQADGVKRADWALAAHLCSSAGFVSVGIRVGIAIRIQDRRIEGRVDDSERVILCEERVFVGDSRFDVVDALDVGKLREHPHSSAGESGRRSDAEGRGEVRERIRARIIVVLVLPHEAASVNTVLELITRVQVGAMLKVLDLRALIGGPPAGR